MVKLAVLSLGGGQDSTAILYKLMYDADFRETYASEDLLVIMSDTGNEHPETYSHIQFLEILCEEYGIDFIFISSDLGFHTESWQDLVSFYKRTSTCGSKAFMKSCTDNLKIKPIYKCLEDYLGTKYGIDTGRKKGYYEFAEKFGKIRMMIGFGADESKRQASRDNDPKWKAEVIEMSYPLIDIGWSRQDCQDYIKSLDFDVPLPSNCMLCPYIREIELIWLERFYPEVYYEWVEIEANKLEKYAEKLEAEGKQNHGVFPCRKGETITLPMVLEKAKAEYGDWNDEQLHEYKMSHGHCVSSKY